MSPLSTGELVQREIGGRARQGQMRLQHLTKGEFNAMESLSQNLVHRL